MAQRRMARGKRKRTRLWFVLLALPLLLASCGSVNLTAGAAGEARGQLEAELAHAQAVGVAQNQIATDRAREQHIDGSRGLFGLSDTQATVKYTTLLNAVAQQENDAIASTQAQASDDLTELLVAIERGQTLQIVPDSFMQRWRNLRNDLQLAATPNDMRAVDQRIMADLATINAMGPAHDALTQFGAAVQRMQAAGLPVTLEATELTQAQQQFASGATAGDFAQLTNTLRASLLGMVNDQAQAIPYLGAALISGLQQRIDLAGSYGETTTTFRTYLSQDQASLTQATSLPQYLSLADQVSQQTSQLSLPLARGQARQDIAQLQALIAYCQQQNIPAYEYASDLGIGSVQDDFAAAQSITDYQAVDGAAAILLQNLRASIANYIDATPHDQPHKTDLALMRSNQVMQGKVIVISLREQTARLYDNGQLALWTYITTGRPERPSPPGVWHILDAQSPITFVSGDDPNSPLYYQPTTIHYALLFHDGGFYIHDAWWRLQFGPGSNMPHNDPQAFNGGSHGCVNVPLQQMAQIYQWAPIGTPVIVY